MKRKSYNNQVEFEELEKPVDITISTKVPSKWAFVDMETGDVWIKNKKGRFIRPNEKEVKILSDLLSKIKMNWLMNKAENSTNRYIEDENFLLDLLEMNWFKRAFCSFRLIFNFLNTRY